MQRAQRTVAIGLVCLMSAVIARAQKTVEVKSPHFLVVTDAGEQRGRDIATRFEHMRAAFGALFNRWKVNTAAPVEIVAFRSTRDFRRFAPLWKGKPVNSSGFFQGTRDRNFIALDASVESGWGTVFHEYAHLLLNNNFPPMPAWYDEGFAEYCASLRVDKKQIEFGLLPGSRADVLRNTAWMHVLDLFHVRHESREYNENDRQQVFYAQSWITVHYLMANRMNKELAEYLELTENQNVPVREAIQKAFGMDARRFENAIRDYFLSGRMKYFRAPAPADLGDGAYAVRSLSDMDWKAVWGDLQYHSRDHHEEGVELFREVLKQQPDNAIANRGLGYSYLEHNDFDQAAEYFKRAAATDSQDPRVHYLTALLANRKAMGGNLTPQETATMRQEVETAIRLDPTFADAYHLLAFIEEADNHLEAERAAIRKALELNPRNEFYLMTSAQCELRAQNYKEAEPMLRRLRESQNTQVAQFASTALNALAAARVTTPQEVRKPEIPVTATQWDKAAQEEAVEDKEPEPAPPPQMSTIRFFKGKLVKVDCSAPPGAVLTLESGAKQAVMFTRDTKSLLLIGAEEFSCAWKDRKAAANYRLQKDGRGELVSLEID